MLAVGMVACASEPSSHKGGAGGGSGTAGSGTLGGTAGTAGTGGGTGGGAGVSAAAGGSSAGSNSTGGSPEAGSGGSAGSSSGGIPSAGRAGSAGTGAGGSSTGGSAGTLAGAGNGNAGTAGSGTAGGAGTGALALPPFVTSAANDYWNTTGKIETVAAGTATVTVDAGTKHQQFVGFGGCFNEMGWDALSVLTAEDVTKAMTLLFDAKAGANFLYGRLPMGASDYSMSWYTLDDTTGSATDYAMDQFSIARDKEKLIPYIKAALAIRPDLKLWASPWVVPAWMMSGSTMKNDAQTLGAHALYMSRFVEEYAKEGLKLVAIHPQNEPGYARVHWTQAQFIDFIKTYLGPTFAQRNITAEIWCGTMSKDPDDTNIAKAAAADADAMKYIKGFGVQWNLQAAVAGLSQTAPVWQTEHKCGNYNFATAYWDQSRYDSAKPQNDHLYGEESWQLIRDWIVAGVSGYSAWNMVLDTIGMSLDKWPQNALLTVDRSAKKLIVTPAYYAFRHFSQYVQPNATVIDVKGSSDALAFSNPDGSIVTELYNKGSAATQTTLQVGATLYQFSVPAHGWATVLTPP